MSPQPTLYFYRSNIAIDETGNAYPGRPGDYITRVLVVLDGLARTRTATAVVDMLEARSQMVTIMPVEEFCASLDGLTSGDDDAPATAGGSSSIIRFQPEQWPQGIMTGERTLLHELFHGVRRAYGLREGRPLGGGWGTEEEIFSVFVENMYAEEAGLPLRQDHRRPIQTPRHDTVLDHTLREPMRRMYSRASSLIHRLAAVSTRYNPFREYEQRLQDCDPWSE